MSKFKINDKIYFIHDGNISNSNMPKIMKGIFKGDWGAHCYYINFGRNCQHVPVTKNCVSRTKDKLITILKAQLENDFDSLNEDINAIEKIKLKIQNSIKVIKA